mmetsp:Transcript_15697/g.23284  ORF Transcript_15697/g.23284 Transcript_15697/m.23284 type:complete len:232 (-) Transcript_15697:507-1202(-)
MLWNLSIRSLPLPLNWHSPSLSHKTIHDTFIFPTCIFFIAGYASLHIPDVYMNRMVCTSFLFCIVIYCGTGYCRSREKRTALRRNLVKNAARLVSEDEDEEDEEVDEVEELQQSWCDLNCAHSLIGCYRSDIPDNAPYHQLLTEQNAREDDLCSCMWRMFTNMRCGKLCKCYFMFCGVCAIAQEVEMMIPMESRRFDYITFQVGVHPIQSESNSSGSSNNNDTYTAHLPLL